MFDESIALETQKGEKKSVKLNHKDWGLVGTDSPLLLWTHIPSCSVPRKESLLPEGETLEGVCGCLCAAEGYVCTTDSACVPVCVCVWGVQRGVCVCVFSRGEGYVYVSVHVCVCTAEERVCVSVGVYTAEGSVFVCVYSRWKSVCVCPCGCIQQRGVWREEAVIPAASVSF